MEAGRATRNGLAPPDPGALGAAERWLGLARTAPRAEAVSAEAPVGVQCSVCARTPLVGEWTTAHADGGGVVWLCELCESEPRRSARLGAPLRRARVRSTAASNVRRGR
jgi:hypothetical protein